MIVLLRDLVSAFGDSVMEDEFPAQAIRRRLLNGEVTVQDLYKIKGCGRDSVDMILWFTGLKIKGHDRAPLILKRGEEYSFEVAETAA